MIRVSDLSYHHGRTQVLDQVTLTMPKGGITALVGANGGGQIDTSVVDRQTDAPANWVHPCGRSGCVSLPVGSAGADPVHLASEHRSRPATDGARAGQFWPIPLSQRPTNVRGSHQDWTQP